MQCLDLSDVAEYLRMIENWKNVTLAALWHFGHIITSRVKTL